MFENVTYTHYSLELGRAAVPDEIVFNSLKLTNIEYMKTLLPFVEEREAGGIDNAVCLMIEAEYLDTQTVAGNDESVGGESIGGYSYQVSEAVKLAQQKNFKTTEQKKLDAVRLFCFLNTAVS